MLAIATTLWLPVSAVGGQHQVAMSPELVHQRFVKCGYDVTPPVLLGQLPLGTAVQVAPSVGASNCTSWRFATNRTGIEMMGAPWRSFGSEAASEPRRSIRRASMPSHSPIGRKHRLSREIQGRLTGAGDVASATIGRSRS